MLIFSVIWPYIKLLMMVSGTSLGRFVAAGCTTFLCCGKKNNVFLREKKWKKQNMFLKGKKVRLCKIQMGKNGRSFISCTAQQHPAMCWAAEVCLGCTGGSQNTRSCALVLRHLAIRCDTYDTDGSGQSLTKRWSPKTAEDFLGWLHGS